MQLWPFPGDSPIARSRKVALAYRQLAKEQHDRAVDLIEALSLVTADQWAELVGHDNADDLFKALHQEYGDPVSELDRRFLDWGETWHCEVEAGDFGPDDYIDSEQAAKLIQISARGIQKLRARGRIDGVFVPDSPGARRGQWRFKVSDVYKLSEEHRPRGWNLHKGTDTLRDSGRGDAE